MNFVGVSDTAFLNDSDFNLINMNGSFDKVHDFNNSNSNTIAFNAGANFDTLSGSSANNNSVTFSSGAVSDVVALLGLTNENVTVSGSNDFLVFNSLCTGVISPVTGSNLGTAGSPDVIC